MTRWETPDGHWTVDAIVLSLVTQSEGIAGNGLPPLEGPQFRVRANGRRTLVGYVRSLPVLQSVMGRDFGKLTEVST